MSSFLNSQPTSKPSVVNSGASAAPESPGESEEEIVDPLCLFGLDRNCSTGRGRQKTSASASAHANRAEQMDGVLDGRQSPLKENPF